MNNPNEATSLERFSWRWGTLRLDNESFFREAWTCSLCPCSQSFHMCQRRQWFPDDSDSRWSSCTSVLSRWVNVKIGGCSLQCRPPPGLSPGHRLCVWSVYGHGSLRCPLSSSHSPAPSHAFRAETDACAGASASSFPPLRKQIPEEKTDPHRSVHPSVQHIHPRLGEWPRPSFPVLSQAPSRMLVRQQVHQSSPTSGLSFRGVCSSVSSWKKNKATLELYSLTVFMLVIQRHPFKKKKKKNNS